MLKQLKSTAIRPCHSIRGRSWCTFTAAVCSLSSLVSKTPSRPCQYFPAICSITLIFTTLKITQSSTNDKSGCLPRGQLLTVIYFVLSLAPNHMRRDNSGELSGKSYATALSAFYISNSVNSPSECSLDHTNTQKWKTQPPLHHRCERLCGEL